MKKCELCMKEFEVGKKDFCSRECLLQDLKSRIDDAINNDKSHTQKMSM